MGKFRRAARSRWRLISTWSLLGLFAIYYQSQQYCQSLQEVTCEQIAEEIGFYLTALFVVLFPLLGYLTYRRIFAHKLNPGFKNEPWKYNHKTIQLVGKVKYIFPNPLGIKANRRLKDWFRKVIDNRDPTSRYIHQSFLITSPALRWREQLMVYHNIKFGKVSLRRGKWVTIQGVYNHQLTFRRSFFGKRATFYGRMHYTHLPKGFINVLSKRPIHVEVTEVPTGIPRT